MKKIYLGVSLLLSVFGAKAQFPAPYCAEVFPNGVEPITNVVFNTINNTSSATTTGATAHENFTAITTTVQQGSTYTLQVKGNTDGPYQDGVRAFFDFNNNGVFTDPGESFTVGVLENSNGTDSVVSVSITIPATATVGSVRMRVSKKYGYFPTPCNAATPGIANYGQAEDYTLNIIASACALPTNIQFSNVSIPNATITWTAGTGVTTYEYAITTSSTPPTSGTSTTSTTATVSNLPTNTALFAYVRSVCSSGVYTSWTRKVFIPCTSPISPTNGASNVSVPTNFNWAPIAGVSSYRIYLSTDNGVTYPVAGTFGNPPAANVTGLSYNTSYRWYVRGIIGTDTAAANCSITNSTAFTTQFNNDSCGRAITLIPGTSITGMTDSATQSLPPSTCNTSLSDGALDVWYSITAQFNGALTISTTGVGSFDPVLGIYSGTCTSPSLINCSDTSADGETEAITINNAVAGTTYLIRVYSWYLSGFTDSTGTFTIRATGSALPVTGVVLSAIRNSKNVQLGWQTLTEANNTGFEIQRSADGSNFSSFLKVASKANGGNSSSAINYTAEDVKPLSGANYYRLKQTDKDGKISYSNVVYLKGLSVSNLTLSAIYPNPTKDVLKAAVQAPTAETITFVLTDMMGKTISRQTAQVISGDNIINLNVSNLANGNYLLKAICSNGCETAVQKFTKQ